MKRRKPTSMNTGCNQIRVQPFKPGEEEEDDATFLFHWINSKTNSASKNYIKLTNLEGLVEPVHPESLPLVALYPPDVPLPGAQARLLPPSSRCGRVRGWRGRTRRRGRRSRGHADVWWCGEVAHALADAHGGAGAGGEGAQRMWHTCKLTIHVFSKSSKPSYYDYMRVQWVNILGYGSR